MKKSKIVVEPSLKFDDGKPHVFEKMVEDGKKVYKAVGYGPMGDGSGKYTSYVLHIKGDEVFKAEVEEPDIRGIAEESAKMAFVREFMGGEM